jgi:hypothetical protein
MRPTPHRWLVVLLALSHLTCAGDKIGGPTITVATVALTSSIGNRLAVARTATVTAVARDAAGAEVPAASFAWTSSASGVASVSSTGVVTGVSAGSATITASSEGKTSTLTFQVSAPDFTGITSAGADLLMASLVNGLSTAVRTRTQAALALCTTGVTAGNFTTIESCISGVRAEVTAASDATDKALLATIALFVDHIDRLLKL